MGAAGEGRGRAPAVKEGGALERDKVGIAALGAWRQAGDPAVSLGIVLLLPLKSVVLNFSDM